MTLTLRSKTFDKKYHVSMEMRFGYANNYYAVSIYPSYDGGITYGYPIREMTYNDEDKAKNCFSRYCRVAKQLLKETI